MEAIFKVYASIKKIGGNNIRNTAIIKDSDGNILTSPMSQLSRWREYYIEQQRTLDSNTWQRQHHIQNEILDISIEPPTTAEIETALLQLKNGKSAGPDDIPAELLKYGASTLAQPLYRVIRTAWVTNNIPKQWKEGVVITIPKKGDLREC
ncbi:uncharacterized protein LOC142235672 [Haematobia irritans]|uniref:uncharacterized protein LOC142235672 n=1 Tax=Haematobia irritans TaxID=7368 RepID=UPI003F4F7507